ncbi:MAG TPA: tyrosine-type recombinase/integrase [Tepidisphaeraceae bacterium]|nr:tyrosine-type recombinase/integrase [Tepidisphaeraceae bacterium]
MYPDGNGQWTKKVNGRRYRFGSWRTDPQGKAALKEWLDRKDAILAGLDNLRVSPGLATGLTVGELMRQFLARQRGAMLKGELSRRTYGDYMTELQDFAQTVGVKANAADMRPQHFGAYGTHLVTKRKLGRHARKRVIAYVKAMFNWGSGMGLIPAPTFGADFKAPDTTPAAIRQAKSRSGQVDHTNRVATGSEIDKLLAIARPQFRAIILMGANTGMGPADIGRLRWRDIDMDTGELNMPRGKTGADRRGYLWKRTRKALERVRTLKHNRKAIEKEGRDALVFVSRCGLPMYRDVEVLGKDGVSEGVRSSQAISITFRKLVKRAKIDDGLSFYRLRHTFKTFGKKANDRDALDLAMGHIPAGVGKIYDHENIGLPRLKAVAIAVKRGLWPKVKPQPEEGNRGSKKKVAADVAGA